MKVKLEFNDDEEMPARCAMHGMALWSALWEIDQACRSRMKHCDDVSDVEDRHLEHIRDIAGICRSLEDIY